MNPVSAVNSYGINAYQTYNNSKNPLITGIRKSSPASKKKKKLNYSFKQISARVMQAKTASDAFLAYVSTLYKVVELKKKCTQDDYDASETFIALSHAEAILKVARKKKEHLKEEELAEDQCDECTDTAENISADNDENAPLAEKDIASLSEEMAEFSQEEIEEMLKKLEEEMAFESEMNELSEMISPDMSEEDIEELKKKHRAREMMEITKADMKYLKAMFERYAHEKNDRNMSVSNNAADLTDLSYSAAASGQVAAECLSGNSVDINV